MSQSGRDYLALCRQLANAIRDYVYQEKRRQGYVGETLSDPTDLKSVHAIDAYTATLAQQVFAQYDCNLFIESLASTPRADAQFAVYIDPIDGSLNWDRGVGDPCVVIAIAEGPQAECLDDLSIAYVQGLRSGDIYYTQGERALFHSHISGQETEIACRGVTQLAQATAYLRCGYSMAERQLQHSLPLFLRARDIRAVDNAGMELCEIARNAADIMVEARHISDFFNLLAYPILRYAGGRLTDLQGNPLGPQAIQIDAPYDYIACNNAQLQDEALELIQRMRNEHAWEQGDTRFSF